MTVSVLIPVLNGVPWVIDAVGSIVRQTRPADEIILIVDPATTDNTVEEVTSRYAVTVVRSQTTGLAGTFNAGLLGAKGEWIVWQDADDWSRDDRLEALLAHAAAHPDLDAVASCCDFVGSASQPVETAFTRDVRETQDILLTPESIAAAVPVRLVILPPTLMLRTDLLRQRDGLDPTPQLPGMDLIKRWVAAGSRIAKLPAHLYTYRLHAGQMSRRRT